jgi:prepilin-type N-terminal cleavage/methylation domain-containing protein
MRSPLRSGYTLIEILIVLTLVATLAALIFAAMGSARERGQRTVCASNLHQWGTAFAMYIADWDGIEPEKGIPMTHAQLGLPPPNDLDDFEKAYKLYGTAVLFCPDTHYPPWDKGNYGSSYMVCGFEDKVDRSIVAQLGRDYPLIICEMHNADTDFQNQPTWATKNVQVLRISQRIQFHRVPAHAGTFQE